MHICIASRRRAKTRSSFALSVGGFFFFPDPKHLCTTYFWVWVVSLEIASGMHTTISRSAAV
jgi:hypothetical protein